MGTVTTTATAPALRVAGVVYVVCQWVPAAILVVFLVASLLLSGAQVTAAGSPAWDQVVPFPVFPVPVWLLLVPAVIGLGAGLTWALTARPEEAPALTGAIGPTVAAAMAPGFFILAHLGADDAPPYGYVLAVTAISLAVIVAASVIAGARATAARHESPKGEA